jgi:putative transposase
MAIPARKSSPDDILNPARTFFTTTKTSLGKCLLQSDRNAGLLTEVLSSLAMERVFTLHDFVIMPDHLHLLFTVDAGMTVEKAMQLVKGRFSFRLGKEFGFKGEVWQRGFSEVQVLGDARFQEYRRYIANNPVKAGLVDSPEKYPFCLESFAKKKAEDLQGLKPASFLEHDRHD